MFALEIMGKGFLLGGTVLVGVCILITAAAGIAPLISSWWQRRPAAKREKSPKGAAKG